MRLWTKYSYGTGGRCPPYGCRSHNTDTSPAGVNVCYDCGASGW